MLRSLFSRREHQAPVLAAYHRIVEQSRDPTFFLDFAVPDTLDGRFEVLAIHAFLVLHRLKGASAEAAEFAQRLFDAMFADLDRSLRELGAGDLGVGRRVKAMATGFYGRVAAYERGLSDPEALESALRRNLYGTLAGTDLPLAAMARYLRHQAALLAEQPLAKLLAGEIAFSSPQP